MKRLAELQPLFLARPRREKILAVLFLAVLAAIWSGSLLGRVREVSRDLATLRATAKSQAVWLNKEDSIEARYVEAMAKLNNTALPSRSEVMARLEELARKHGIAPFELNPPISDVREGLTFHTFNMSMRHVDYDQLQSFYEEVQSALPSVNLFEVRISANMSNREQLSARLGLVAIELNR